MTLFIGWDANQNVGHGGNFSFAVEKKIKNTVSVIDSPQRVSSVDWQLLSQYYFAWGMPEI